MALYTTSGDSGAITSGTTETNDQWSTAATGMARLVRAILGQTALTSNTAQLLGEFQRSSAVGGTPSAITPRPAQVRDAAGSVTHGTSATEPTYTLDALWHKTGSVLAGLEQTWQRNQFELWVPPSAFAGFKFTPVGATVTSRWTLEHEEIG